MSKTSIEIQSSFPKELQVIETIETPDKIIIKLRSRTHSCECPSCKTTLTHYNSTYLMQIATPPGQQGRNSRSSRDIIPGQQKLVKK